MKRGDLFRIQDFPTVEERGYTHPFPSREQYRVQATGEFRPPRAGEWFISGAIAEGYRARHDMSGSYYIGKLVRVRTRTVTEVIE